MYSPCSGGANASDLIDAMQKEGLATTTGYCLTGIAGFTLGGGYSPLISAYGLVADNLLSAQVVTGDGYSNPYRRRKALMRPLEERKGHESVKGSVTVWRPWQLKSLELFQAVSTSGPPCQQLTQEYRLVCIHSGAAHHRYRNTRDQVVNGTFFVIEPGETLSYQPIDSTFHCLFIDPAWLQQFATEQFQWEQPLPHFPSHGLFDPSLSQALRDLATRSLAPTSRLQQEETLLHLFAPLLLSHAEDTRVLPQPRWEHPAIKRTKVYLEEHHAEQVTLQELAGVMNMSSFHLSRTFSQIVGLPPHAYQTKLRLARAKTLLAQGFDVSYVAHETGFFDQSHFTQQFKRHYQVTPGSYRKTARFS